MKQIKEIDTQAQCNQGYRFSWADRGKLYLVAHGLVKATGG
jgi:hypothetical protein